MLMQGMMVLAYRIQADVLRSAEEDKSKDIKADYLVAMNMNCFLICHSRCLHMQSCNAYRCFYHIISSCFQAALSTAEGLAREHIAKFKETGNKRSEAVLLLAAGEINYNKRGTCVAIQGCACACCLLHDCSE